MNQIILASHGGLAAGLRDTVELIVGEIPNVHVLSTTRDETESILDGTRRLLAGFDPEDAVYILTDVMGGSVNNSMLTLLAENNHSLWYQCLLGIKPGDSRRANQ